MNARTDQHALSVPEIYFATLPSGVRMPYVTRGAGEPLLFVHGSLCDYRYWNGQLAVLSQRFQCVAVSLSHYWPADDLALQGAFNWWTHVHSRGGCVAFHLARDYPHLVKSLTLADPGGPLHADAPLPPATEALRARAAALIDEGDVEAGLELFVDSVSLPGIWRKSPAAFRAMAIDNAATLPMQFRDPLPAYTQEAAAAVVCPTLLIAGGKSPRMYRANVEQLAAWMPRAATRTIAAASHGMNVTHAAEFNRLLEAFVGSAPA